MFKLTSRDNRRLKGVHPDLVAVIRQTAKLYGGKFIVLEGTRTVARQKQLVAKGASKTMNSRHIPAANGLGHAVDIAPVVDGNISWDWRDYHPLAETVKIAAKDVGVNVEWGGDWRTFKDGPHWQLPWKTYTGKTAHIKKARGLLGSRTIQGSSAATAGGATLLVEPIQEVIGVVQRQEDALSSGSMVSLAIAGFIIFGALYAVYARWDDAGRPKLW